MKYDVSGIRFAHISMKIGLASILSEYELLQGKKTPAKINFEKKSFFVASDVGLPIVYKKI